VKAVLAAVTDRLHNYARVHYALQMPEHSTYIDAAVYLRLKSGLTLAWYELTRILAPTAVSQYK